MPTRKRKHETYAAGVDTLFFGCSRFWHIVQFLTPQIIIHHHHEFCLRSGRRTLLRNWGRWIIPVTTEPTDCHGQWHFVHQSWFCRFLETQGMMMMILKGNQRRLGCDIIHHIVNNNNNNNIANKTIPETSLSFFVCLFLLIRWFSGRKWAVPSTCGSCPEEPWKRKKLVVEEEDHSWVGNSTNTVEHSISNIPWIKEPSRIRDGMPWNDFGRLVCIRLCG